MFDYYAIKARVYPIVLVVLPGFIMAAIYSLQFKTIHQLTSSAVIVAALTYLVSQLGRDQGKKKKPQLWSDWGGIPSIQLMRWHNPVIDRHTKERYHNKLQLLFPVSAPPDAQLERHDLNAADEVYQAWNGYIIAKTRDKERFPLLLKENVSYGFRRNLWGMKPIALILLSVLLVGNYVYFSVTGGNFSLASLSTPFFYVLAVLTAIFLFWVFVITKSWVKTAAFAYARRLLETIEVLP